MTRSNTVNAVCPYTGLRSFTEEESLYFKGRDAQVDQITALLEQNKFLMVTGASGEGKSSLVFAGLIPNARAGFFKARYTNWVIADFRPERNPVVNMAKVLAAKFNSNPASVEIELRRGFTSLVDLYTNSEFYTDTESSEWQKLPEEEKGIKMRKASNLMILVDQFEEFFTNPENFFNDAPSQDSQIVVNLILETARIAIKRKLPVYIVCTMRSDYIGQCSAFRGLPEYIGFSQFFVPRLKRKDLKQVIEEPAILSGNAISQRLIERLVFDLAEGVDQLPILQHAMTQIWLAAEGQQEMDLIHYAMVGGMPATELPDADQKRFSDWFNQRPEHLRKYYEITGLDKVIEIHANILYENACDRYNARFPNKMISNRDARKIIALTFSCLTKIDNSRAVRNRMSLAEIAGVINNPELSVDTVGEVLSIYREEGNSFIRPFKTDDPATHTLSSETVLDITHESLIRNWGKLNSWASQEFDFYSTYLDFKKQLDRWKKSGKSSDYLLPIGPLTYFERWYDTCKPNIFWIKRYLAVQSDTDQAIKESEEILNDSREFLKRSARKAMIARAFMKYGSRKIAAFLAILIMLVMSGFYWYDASQKINDVVIQKVRDDSRSLLASSDVQNFTKGIYLLSEEKFEKGSLINYLKNQSDVKYKTILALNSYEILTVIDKKFNAGLKHELIEQILISFRGLESQTQEQEFILNQRLRFATLLAYDNYYNPSLGLDSILASQCKGLYNSLRIFLGNPGMYKGSLPTKLTKAIHLWLTFGNGSQGEVRELLRLLDPDEKKSNAFATYYRQGSFEANGIRPLDYNGGYHVLASLYACLGNTAQVIACFDKLKTDGDYFSERVFNNFSNVIGYSYQYGFGQQVPQLIQWITKNASRTPESIYKELITRSGYMTHLFRANFGFTGFNEEGSFHLNLCLGKRELFNTFVSKYQQIVSQLPGADERNFLLAMQYKMTGLFDVKYSADRGIPVADSIVQARFAKAVWHFDQVSDAYLSQKVAITYPFVFAVRNKEWTRRNLFTYPDYIGSPHSLTFHSETFYTYLSSNDLLQKFYRTSEELDLIHFWVTNRYELRPFFFGESFKNDQVLSDATLRNILSFVDSHKAGALFDRNLFLLLLSNNAFANGDHQNGFVYYQKINRSTLLRSAGKYEGVNKSFILNQMRYLAGHLAVAGKMTGATQLIETFEDKDEKVYGYMLVTDKLYNDQQYVNSLVCLDSAFSKAQGINMAQIPFVRDFRFEMIYLLTKIGGKKLTDMAQVTYTSMNEGLKYDATLRMIKGHMYAGNYYQARLALPATLTEDQDLFARNTILWEASADKTRSKIDWSRFDEFYNWDYIQYKGFSFN